MEKQREAACTYHNKAKTQTAGCNNIATVLTKQECVVGMMIVYSLKSRLLNQLLKILTLYKCCFKIFNMLLCPSIFVFLCSLRLIPCRRFVHYIFHLPSGKNHLYEKGILLALPDWATHFIAVKPSLRFGRNREQRGNERERWEERGEKEMMAQAWLET